MPLFHDYIIEGDWCAFNYDILSYNPSPFLEVIKARLFTAFRDTKRFYLLL